MRCCFVLFFFKEKTLILAHILIGLSSEPAHRYHWFQVQVSLAIQWLQLSIPTTAQCLCPSVEALRAAGAALSALDISQLALLHAPSATELRNHFHNPAFVNLVGVHPLGVSGVEKAAHSQNTQVILLAAIFSTLPILSKFKYSVSTSPDCICYLKLLNAF